MENTFNKRQYIILIAGLLSLTACRPRAAVCPQADGTPAYLTGLPLDSLFAVTPGPSPAPVMMEIGGRSIPIDKVVTGPLCNDSWSGTVYVSCDVQVFAWEEKPLFLKDCSLSIAPDTVVYVAYHNDSAYYNGCSCHTLQTPDPSLDLSQP